MWKIFNKVIWKKPVGPSYYPCFFSDFWYYYVGSFNDNLKEYNDFMFKHDLPIFTGTQKEYTNYCKKKHKNKISKIKYFINGFKEAKLCQIKKK